MEIKESLRASLERKLKLKQSKESAQFHDEAGDGTKDPYQRAFDIVINKVKQGKLKEQVQLEKEKMDKKPERQYQVFQKMPKHLRIELEKDIGITIA